MKHSDCMGQKVGQAARPLLSRSLSRRRHRQRARGSGFGFNFACGDDCGGAGEAWR